MRPSFCGSCLACFLKLLNFLQTFIGVSIVIYSVWILTRWNRSHRLGLDLDDLPAPWFICALFAAGVLLCLVAITGHIAAEVFSGCCLCFYAVLTIIVMLLEAALVGYLVFNKHWEEDLPFDPSGELKRLREFVEDNIDVLKWVALTVGVIQASSLLLALVIRVLIPSRRMDYDSDDDYVIRMPLLCPQGDLACSRNSAVSNGFYSNLWSTRTRQKYGLDQAGLPSNNNDILA